MLSFKQFLQEFSLSKVHATLQKGHPIGTVSPERPGMSKAVKKGAHKAIQARLRRESDKGMVSFSGPHKGRYKAKDGSETKEGSYVVKPGNHPKAKENFHRILKSVGREFDQESVLKGTKKGGALHYQDGKTDSLGKIRYNKPLKKGRGDTQLKDKNASFTFGSDK